MRLGPRGDDLEEFPVEFFEPGRRLLVGLPEQAKQRIERVAIGTLNDLDSNVDSRRAAAEFLPEGMPAGALQRRQLGLLAAAGQLDDRSWKPHHPNHAPLARAPFSL